MSTVTYIRFDRAGHSIDGVKHYTYEIITTKLISDISAAKEAFSAVINSDIRLFSQADMKRCWVEAQESMAKEYGFEGIEEIEAEAPIFKDFDDFMANGFRS